jgi:hypothetical protein
VGAEPNGTDARAHRGPRSQEGELTTTSGARRRDHGSVLPADLGRAGASAAYPKTIASNSAQVLHGVSGASGTTALPAFHNASPARPVWM